jgi:large subunit ribosomal protein L4
MKINVVNAEKKNIDLNLPNFEGDKLDLVLRSVRVYSANQRQGTSKTKKRSEVSGGGKKPWKQKGTGRARSGSTRSPLWVGGGTSNGPKPKNWAFTLNKKVKINALSSALLLKESESKLMAMDTENFKLSTKLAVSIIKDLKSSNILVVSSSNDITKSFRNVFGVNVVRAQDLNAINIVSSDLVLVSSDAVKALEERVNK